MRRFAWGLAGAIGAVSLGVGAFTLYGLSTLPQTSGTVVVSGPNAPMEIRRDQYGIPTIIAANEHDAYFALGYSHAQDRLFQMEMMRRLAQGRLAEILGPKALPSDRFMRTLGLNLLAKASYRQLDGATKAAMVAYADGVNAQLQSGNGLPPEFDLLGLKMQEWQPHYGLLWGRLMGLRLSGNMWEEVLRTQLKDTLPPAALDDLWPALEDHNPTIRHSRQDSPLPAANQDDKPQTDAALELRSQPISAVLPDLLALWPEGLSPQIASNAWVVGGARSTSGKPLLATDPHLDFRLPAQWYLAELRLPHRTIIGATIPGVPFHVIGTNDQVSWAFTTTHSDTMDLFYEKLGMEQTYRTDDGLRPLILRTEVITVRGQDPVSLTIRSTHHGPIITDLLPDMGDGDYVISLSATALQPTDQTAIALRKLTLAGSVDEAMAAMPLYNAPQQNLLLADHKGDVLYSVVGRTPERPFSDGLGPFPGWTGEHDWDRWVSLKKMPLWQADPQDIVINANNRPKAGDLSYLSSSWQPSYRADRITEILDTDQPLTQDDMLAAQLDQQTPLLTLFFPYLENALSDKIRNRSAQQVGAPLSPRAAQAYELLKAWDGNMDPARPEPLILSAWLLRLQDRLIGGALGPLYARWNGLSPHSLEAILKSAIQPETADQWQWCDKNDQGCSAAILTSFEDAMRSLDDELGGSPADWRWSDVHTQHLEHPLFRHVPILDWLSQRNFPTPGGAETVNRASFAGGPINDGWAERLQDVHGASFRMTVDLGNYHSIQMMLAGGQSGNPFSSHYDDLLDLWKSNTPISQENREIQETLFLEPDGK